MEICCSDSSSILKELLQLKSACLIQGQVLLAVAHIQLQIKSKRKRSGDFGPLRLILTGPFSSKAIQVGSAEAFRPVTQLSSLCPILLLPCSFPQMLIPNKLLNTKRTQSSFQRTQIVRGSLTIPITNVRKTEAWKFFLRSEMVHSSPIFQNFSYTAIFIIDYPCRFFNHTFSRSFSTMGYTYLDLET